MLLVPCPDPFYQLVCPSPAVVHAGSALPRNAGRLPPPSGGGLQPMSDYNGTPKSRPFASRWDNFVVKAYSRNPQLSRASSPLYPTSFSP